MTVGFGGYRVILKHSHLVKYKLEYATSGNRLF